MAMSYSYVSVADDGTITKPATSMATAIFEALNNAYGIDESDFKAVGALQGMAVLANALSQAIVTHIKTYSEVKVVPGDVGLQRDPSSGLSCLAPNFDKTLGTPVQ